MMKATLFKEHGSPEVLTYSDFPDPTPEPHQVLIEVKAVALNHLDLFVRGGIPGLKLEMPHILGSDISGVITEVGSSVSEFEKGQKVIVDPRFSGSYETGDRFLNTKHESARTTCHLALEPKNLDGSTITFPTHRH